MEEIDEIRMPARDDAALEAAVLSRLLDLHPVQLTHAELVRELAGDAADFEQGDAVERAVHELSTAGLAHRNGDIVLPSRAALRMEELFE